MKQALDTGSVNFYFLTELKCFKLKKLNTNISSSLFTAKVSNCREYICCLRKKETKFCFLILFFFHKK